ncbi:TRAP transporter TAXI family solute receptor [Rhodobium orientis]|uniref:TRAP transporter substrate-binding protein n=1 Tax=Rhodobium orientis TaxID=34017 RepID=A0A327JR02_9HYPH|nr:TAXI family TRAP transporter solute-binding subunit [Rhodobium orientis]MBB4303702.1 TRAP transporter TAXI family solute receptor [Rhodobium orientis]MBK5951843.1 hypothetical protein [Rhodobium orientis]RAI28491.1 hypothetical protein CH339_06285 [Rhodobium orientis]
MAGEREGFSRRLAFAALIGLAIGTAVVLAAVPFSNKTEFQRLTVAAGPRGSDAYQLLSEIAEVVERHSETLRLTVRESGGSSENVGMIRAGTVDLAAVHADTPAVNVIRLISHLYKDYFQLIARDKAGISGIRDLVGKRIALPPFGTDEFRAFWMLARHYDLAVDDFRWKAMSLREATEAIAKNQVDAVFALRSLHDRLILHLISNAGLVGTQLAYVPIDQTRAIAINRPFLDASVIVKGAFDGDPPLPATDIQAPTIERLLVARADLDPMAIRELTGILFEQRLDLIVRTPLADEIAIPDASIGLSVPLHDGADAYYRRDEPSFIQENAEPLALLVTVIAMVMSAGFALRARLVANRKNRADSYNYQLLALANEARDAESVETLDKCRDSLHEIRESVVVALDTDDVTEEGFQSFAFLWDSVRIGIDQRRAEIGSGHAAGEMRKQIATRHPETAQ